MGLGARWHVLRLHACALRTGAILCGWHLLACFRGRGGRSSPRCLLLLRGVWRGRGSILPASPGRAWRRRGTCRSRWLRWRGSCAGRGGHSLHLLLHPFHLRWWLRHLRLRRVPLRTWRGLHLRPRGLRCSSLTRRSLRCGLGSGLLHIRSFAEPAALRRRWVAGIEGRKSVKKNKQTRLGKEGRMSMAFTWSFWRGSQPTSCLASATRARSGRLPPQGPPQLSFCGERSGAPRQACHGPP